jgi:hypothetical protein
MTDTLTTTAPAQAPAPAAAPAQLARKIGMTAAEQFWYVLGCIAFGAAYLQKVPVKKALADYGLVTMTGAEQFWYVLGCIAFGIAYFMKVPVAKALAELGQFRAARAAPRDQLATLPAGEVQAARGAAQLEAAAGAGRIAGAREPDRQAQMTHAA